jgi:Domain of unknown function (DUF5615)
MLAGFFDQHVNRAVVSGLRRRGMDVVTAYDRGLSAADDDVLLATAAGEGRLMVTNDTDFLVWHSKWQATGRNHAGIIYWHQDKFPVGEAINRILQYATFTSAADAANVVKFL